MASFTLIVCRYWRQSSNVLLRGQRFSFASLVDQSRQWGLRCWRLLALALVAWLLHTAAHQDELRSRTPSVDLPQARRFFPRAVQVSPSDQNNGADGVFDENGKLLGYLINTSPQADSVIGYVGPNSVLVAMDDKGRVNGAELLSSGDTEAHVSAVKSDEAFWKRFVGWTPSREPMPRIDAVAGSTLTSLGIAEAVQKRLAGRVDSLRFPEPLTLKEVQGLFPAAQRFEMEESHRGWYEVKDNSGTLLGFAVRTSPFSDYTHGHSGPTESLVAVAPDGKRVLGVRLRKSYDTEDYVNSVREDAVYLGQLTNFTVEQWATLDFKKAGLEGVSGATETSFAVAEGIRDRFAADAAGHRARSSFFKPRDWALLGIVTGSLVMTFSGLRGRRWVRIAWQAILIGVFGLWCGDLLSLALLAGWARHGVNWQIAPSLVLLATIALLVPWGTRRQLYCHQLCPHGAAQEWLGKFKKLHVRVPNSVVKYLRVLPVLLLAGAIIIGLVRPRFDLASLEPFDAWALKGLVSVAAVIAVCGLLASLFVPMAYCRFGCPTGALLKFVRATGTGDHFGLRDWAAVLLLALGSGIVFWSSSHVVFPKKTEDTVELHGTCFGTTWNVKLRGKVADAAGLQQRLAAELERIESNFSHWRSNSATSHFNAARTTQPIEMPEELVRLVSRALEMSRISDGAFDITVAPLVKAWGFGPGGVPPNAPTEEEVAQLRAFTGWEKLKADTNAHTLQKSHPELQIDMGAILQGYGADCLAILLNADKQTNYLIDVGGEFLAKGRWRVGIEDPAQPDRSIYVLTLENSALATSGTYRAKHTDGKKKWTHLINPHTGNPIEHDTTLVSVLHSSCVGANLWSTSLIVTGGGKAEALAKTNGISVLMVTGGRVVSYQFPKDQK
jgi:NosR/NirI family transcriptional regulator, nitrous oxide reductase regulator